MARQKGFHKIRGTVGDGTYFQTQDGLMVRDKGSLDKSRIEKDPGFALTRMNMSEFGRAGKAAKLIRFSLDLVVSQCSEPRMTSRLMQVLMRAQKADTISPRGERNVADGEVLFLQSFEFNAKVSFTSTVHLVIEPIIDRRAGKLTLRIPPFIPADKISMPQGATHCMILSGASEIDFKNGMCKRSEKSSAYIPLNHVTLPEIVLEHQLTEESEFPLFLAVGIVFTAETNGVKYPIQNDAYNAGALLKVEA